MNLCNLSRKTDWLENKCSHSVLLSVYFPRILFQQTSQGLTSTCINLFQD